MATSRKPTSNKPSNVADLSSKLSEKLNEVSQLSQEDRANFILESITENLPSDDVLQKMAELTAKARFIAYKAHLDAGFSEEQAMTLCVSR